MRTERDGSQYARSLIEASLDPLVAISAEGKITDVNEAAITVTGVARERLIGSDFCEYFTDPGKAREGYQLAFAQGLVSDYLLTIRHRDGKLIDVVYNASVYRDVRGKVLGVFAAARDVTDRKRREAILQEVQSFAEAIVETVREPLLVLDKGLHVKMANPSFLRTFRASKGETEGQLLYELGNGQWDIPELRRLLEDIIPQHTEFRDFEVTHDFPAIGRRTMLLNARKLSEPGVNSELFLLAMEDTTARKQAEEALLKAGALQNAIFNSANFSSIATDANGVIQIFNVGAERMLGYTAADVMNKITPADISDPQEVIARAKALSVELGTPITPGFEALVFKASRGIEDIYELTYIRKDGSRFPAVVSVTALRDAQGAIIGYLLIGTDNTARKQVEEERMKLDQRLRDQQFYTRSLIESNIDAIMTTDPQGIITDVNKQMEALTGCTRDELIGAPFKSYFTDPERAEAGIRLVLSEKKVTNYELTARTRDGKQTVVSYNATTFYDRERKLQGVFAAARDVTERKRLDDALEEAKKAAEDANSAKSDFLARMSHEIRTPMNAIVGMADLLWETSLAPEQREYVRIFRKAGSQLLDLINDILDLSKVESGHLTLESLDFDLGEVLDKSLEIMAIRAHEKGLELALSIAPEVSTGLVGDPARLRQVLIDLVGNAIKFTENGEVVVRVEADSEKKTAGALRFAVCDTGIGIPEEAREQIFAPYSQVDTSTTRKFGGTGLGLTISRRVVELMQGRIWVESAIGIGSTFYFTAQFATGSKNIPRAPSGAIDLKEVKTLIIDDNATNRLILREMLSRWGAVVTEADGGERGVAELVRAKQAGSPYSVVLLDRRMPGVDGFQVAERIFQDPGVAETTILMLTSENRAGDVARGRELGLAAYLVKPVKQAELLEAIQEARGGAVPAAKRPAVQARDIPAGAQSLRILLVEDSQDNVLLIQSYLKSSGYGADVACNGAVALEKFISGTYDIVLMDVQMPIMDGYSATRKIRQWEAEHHAPPIPILALTAHALPEEVRKSLDAGCTAHLTKPVRKATLIGAIEQHAMGVVRVGSSVAELVPGFLAGRRRDVETIAAALERADYESVRFLGHNMKGSGAGYGFDRITEIGASLEQAAGRRAPEEIRIRAAELVRYLDGLHVKYE
ncbi:MAG: PAS domain S-box protein [Casimicrobiaceae bacterium]